MQNFQTCREIKKAEDKRVIESINEVNIRLNQLLKTNITERDSFKNLYEVNKNDEYQIHVTYASLIKLACYFPPWSVSITTYHHLIAKFNKYLYTTGQKVPYQQISQTKRPLSSNLVKQVFQSITLN